MVCWPNFETFYKCFKDHPSLRPGKVDASCLTPVPAAEVVVSSEVQGDLGKIVR